MNSREIVEATLTFNGPERVARSFNMSDFIHVSYDVATRATAWREVGGERWERLDEWGNVWGRVDPTSKGEVIRGVLEDLNAVDSYVFPDFGNPADYDDVRRQREATPDLWLIGGLPGFTFNIARKMRRFEQYLMDILLERETIAHLHDRVDDVLATMICNYAAAGVDSVMFPEDWGTQKQLLISPRLWRDEFFPRFQRLCSIAHENGIRVFMHSCGQIEAIVPDLIAAGIDVLQFDQPDLHGIDTLAGYQEQAPITFWCPVDIQTTLQTRDRATIASKAHEMLDKLWRGRGGFIAGYYGDNVSIGLTPEWQNYACDTFVTYGRRERYL